MIEKSDTIQKVKQIFIGNPQISEILADIAECREFSDGVLEPDCMIVVGDTGSGKTTIIDKYLSENPRKEHDEGSVVPILFTTLPPNATPITASEQLLCDLGDPFAFQKGKDHVELTKKMVELMRKCRVELIIIDEFQHMIDRKNKEVLHSAADWLKLLIVRSKIPVVLFGMPYSTVILDTNKQLAGRFELQHKLEPFRVDNKENVKKYRTFLKYLDDALPFAQRSDLVDKDMMKRIYVFSKGNMRRIRRLINRASRLAINEGQESLLLKHFEKVAPKVSRDACTPHNPFSIPVDRLKIEHPPENVGWENYLIQQDKDVSIDDAF